MGEIFQKTIRRNQKWLIKYTTDMEHLGSFKSSPFIKIFAGKYHAVYICTEKFIFTPDTAHTRVQQI
jgi:hypothetical protein